MGDASIWSWYDQARYLFVGLDAWFSFYFSLTTSIPSIQFLRARFLSLSFSFLDTSTTYLVDQRTPVTPDIACSILTAAARVPHHVD